MACRCGSDEVVVSPAADGVHKTQRTCGKCSRWLGWDDVQTVIGAPRPSGSWASRAENLMIAIAATKTGVTIGQYQQYVAEAEALATEAQASRNGGRR